MTEAFDDQILGFPDEDEPSALQLVHKQSPEMAWMFMLLEDGARGVIDYRGCADTGEPPRRYFEPYPIGKTVLRLVED
jgi:hypothetical protein